MLLYDSMSFDVFNSINDSMSFDDFINGSMSLGVFDSNNDFMLLLIKKVVPLFCGRDGFEKVGPFRCWRFGFEIGCVFMARLFVLGN